MELTKVQKISDWPTPKIFKEIQRFLKFTNYNQQFIKRYSKISHPLTTLAKKNILFKWGQKQKKTFKQLKQTCNNHLVLCIYNPTKSIQLETNTNNLAIKTYLTQKYDNKRHPIAYYSKKCQK